MKIFGGRVGTTINDSANAVDNTTSRVFNQLEGNSGGSGGSGNTGLVNVGPIYEMKAVMGLNTENQKNQMVNNGFISESQAELFTGTAYKYNWTLNYNNQAGEPSQINHKQYELEDKGTKYAVLVRIPGEDRTGVHTGAGTDELGDSGKNYTDITIGETLTIFGETWEILVIETSIAIPDNSTELYIVYDTASYLVDESTKAEILSNGVANEYWFKLYSGDVYRYTRGYYKESRLYFMDLEDHRTIALLSEGSAVGEVYDGSTVMSAGWEDGEKVAHE